jgi:hypothetical protein
MATINITYIPKAPRWINTQAGQWAWHEYSAWREQAAHALSVQERTRLLNEAEELLQARSIAA